MTMSLDQFHRLLRSDDMKLVNKAANELGQLSVAEAVSLLEELALDPEAEFRCRAVHRMPLVSAERAEALAIRLLADPDEAVRWTACETLLEVGSKRALPRLAQMLATDSDSLVRSFAAFTLGELGDESFLPVLMDAVKNDNGTDHEGRPIRETASKAIRNILSRSGT